ncbi:MAG TPA: Mce protein [Mycobacterium sp.]|jgi:Mce-associated membrane protein|nr:Mce protein [Mycobacterium sp.]
MADDAAAPEGELTGKTPEGEKGSTSEADADTTSDAGPTSAADADPTRTEEATEATEADEAEGEEAEPVPAKPPMSVVRLATIAGLVLVVALAGLTGWLGFRAYESHKADEQRKLFLQVGRQGALNLTTIDWQQADVDVQRIVDSATGTFYDDFQKRAQPFTEVVKQAQSKSVGTIAEAGLESAAKNEAQVLVAVTVKTSNAGAPEQRPRAWRMRITVEKVGDEAKVSNVEFVP